MAMGKDPETSADTILIIVGAVGAAAAAGVAAYFRFRKAA